MVLQRFAMDVQTEISVYGQQGKSVNLIYSMIFDESV